MKHLIIGAGGTGRPRESFKEMIREIGALAEAMGHPFHKDIDVPVPEYEKVVAKLSKELK